MNVEPAIIVAVVSGATGLGGALALVRNQAKTATDEVRKLRDDLRGELAPIVKIAEEALRKSSAAFEVIDGLREEAQRQAGQLERLDERTSFLKNTARFRLRQTADEDREE